MKDTPAVDLSHISRAYNASLSPPKDAESLRAIIKDFWGAGLMSDPDQVLRSSRDGEPYEIVFSLPPKTSDSAIIAYEKVGADGTRFVLTRQGQVKQLTTAEFGKGPFPIGHVPPAN